MKIKVGDQIWGILRTNKLTRRSMDVYGWTYRGHSQDLYAYAVYYKIQVFTTDLIKELCYGD